MKKVELENLKPEKGIINIELEIEAKNPLTGKLIKNIVQNLIKNGLLKPDQEYAQKLLNVITNSIDETIKCIEHEIKDENETRH